MIGREGLVKGFLVAADALGGKTEAIELSNSSHFVAGIAINHCVRANQGETVLVLIDAMNGYLPTVGVVAQFAFRAILAAMQVGMAVLALIGSICKLQIGVAIPACDDCMASAQRKAGSCVIEFDLALNYLPICRGVTGGAWKIELAMRTLRSCKRPD